VTPGTSLTYRLLARVAFGALPLVAPFSAKLRDGLAGRRAGGQKLRQWGATHRNRSRPLLWFHAPSVGEGLQARAILEIIRSRHPDWQIAFTHFSPSAESSAARQPADVHAYLPPDVPDAVDAALDALHPSALVFVKLDVWPELATRAASRGIPVLLLAATVSSVSGRTRWPARVLTRPAYEAITRAGAIAEADAGRLALLGVSRDLITITGDPRFDSVAAMVASAGDEKPLLQRTTHKTLVAGSTWGRDETVLLEAYAIVRRQHPAARLVIVPHEPTGDHLDTVDRNAAQHGLPKPVRLASATGGEDFVLVDRVGVLARLYGVGEIAYVGGGFGRAGLHSVLEPAAWGVPVIFGPSWRSSREAGLLLQSGGGVSLPSAGQLAETWLRWITSPDARSSVGNAALQVVRSGLGGAEANARLVETAI
jgi:3-deoxy-D-manno-octulosonic-acid transferase